MKGNRRNFALDHPTCCNNTMDALRHNSPNPPIRLCKLYPIPSFAAAKNFWRRLSVFTKNGICFRKTTYVFP